MKDNSQLVKRGYERWQFDDFEEFMQEMETDLTPEEREAWGEIQSHRASNGHWEGTKTWREAIHLARTGWENGTEQFTDAMESMTPYVIAALGEKTMDLAPAGYAPDVAAFCAGSPACMMNQGETFNQRTPVLRMLVDMNGSGGVEGKSWIMRGAAICSLIDYFEQIGISCEVELGAVSRAWHQGQQNLVEWNVTVKRASDHIEPDRLAFALGNPAMLRRFDFFICEKSQKAPMGSSYGSVVGMTPDADQIYFDSLTNYRDAKHAMEVVLKDLAEYLEPELKQRLSEDWADIIGDSRAAL